MSGGPLPRTVRRLSITSVLVAAIACIISISHLGVYSHYFTICAFVATFIYWMIFTIYSTRLCTSDVEEKEPTHHTTRHHAASIDSRTAIYRSATPSMIRPSNDGYINLRQSPPRQDSGGPAPEIPYPSQTTHALNLFVSFALAVAWSGGSWIPIVNGMEEGPEIVILTMSEGVLGYIDAVIMWAIFLHCLRARAREGMSQELIGMYSFPSG